MLGAQSCAEGDQDGARDSIDGAANATATQEVTDAIDGGRAQGRPAFPLERCERRDVLKVAFLDDLQLPASASSSLAYPRTVSGSR
jgi:hypothetical protein